MEIDRISSLPDDLLHQILSFLDDTRYAVQTCVLSKRWVSLWKSLPYLDFNLNSKGLSSAIIINNDISLVSRVIAKRSPVDLVKVRLSFSIPDNKEKRDLLLPHAQSLISYVVDHKVQKLEIHFDHISEGFWPQSFSTCQSLTALTLQNIQPWNLSYGDLELPKCLALPALKSLHLVAIPINFDPLIFSTFPNLEILQLDSVWFGLEEILRFHGLNLRSLKISRAMRFNLAVNTYVVEIDAPKLITFEYSGFSDIQCSAVNLSTSLDHVHFDLRKRPMKAFTQLDFYLLMDNFKEFRLAKSITLTLDTVKLFSKFPALLGENFPASLGENSASFANLKHLNVKVGDLKRIERFSIPEWLLDFFGNSSTLLKICP